MTYFTDEARVDASSVSTVNDVDVGTSDTRKSPLLLLFVSVNLIWLPATRPWPSVVVTVRTLFKAVGVPLTIPTLPTTTA